jgi:hypothetical protein
MENIPQVNKPKRKRNINILEKQRMKKLGAEIQNITRQIKIENPDIKHKDAIKKAGLIYRNKKKDI